MNQGDNFLLLWLKILPESLWGLLIHFNLSKKISKRNFWTKVWFRCQRHSRKPLWKILGKNLPVYSRRYVSSHHLHKDTFMKLFFSNLWLWKQSNATDSVANDLDSVLLFHIRTEKLGANKPIQHSLWYHVIQRKIKV